MNPRKEVAQKNWGSGLWTAPSPPQAGGPEPPAPGPRRPRCRRRGFPWVPPCCLPKHARPAVHPASTDRAPRRAVTVRMGACVPRPWPQGRDTDAAVDCTVTPTAQPRPAPSGLRDPAAFFRWVGSAPRGRSQRPPCSPRPPPASGSLSRSRTRSQKPLGASSGLSPCRPSSRRLSVSSAGTQVPWGGRQSGCSVGPPRRA